MNEAPTADGGPGFLAFVAFFVLAIALWFLMRNMNARMRRMSYRQQAAHRSKDDPQAGPGDLGAQAGRPPADQAPGGQGPGAAGEVGGPPRGDRDDADPGDASDGTPKAGNADSDGTGDAGRA